MATGETPPASFCDDFNALPYSSLPAPCSKMTPTGLEHAQQCSISGDSAKCAAKITALAGDSELAAVVEAWPTLPVEVRAEIVALVEAATLARTPDASNLDDGTAGRAGRRQKRA